MQLVSLGYLLFSQIQNNGLIQFIIEREREIKKKEKEKGHGDLKF